MPSACHVSTLALLWSALASARSIGYQRNDNSNHNDASVLILGGGVAGVIAARTLYEQGITDFKIIEARDELGGRMKNHIFGAAGRELTVEMGANWVQGTQTGNGPENPIWALAKKHNLETVYQSYTDSITTFDYTGQVDYLDVFNRYSDDYVTLTVSAGARVDKELVDTTARTGYSLIKSKPKTPHEMASEYWAFDWEYAQTPEESSWIASSWANNFTYDADEGGFSEDNQLAIDQRGFKTIIQQEAAEFLQPDHLLLNATVDTISYSGKGVSVNLTDGSVLSADYALVTFSVGVLQHDDVKFEPELPQWKQEAIDSMTMATYTKVFLQFPENFWFDTEFGLYADRERGRYPVWQSLDHPQFFPGSGVIFVTVTGDYSQRIESLPDSQVQDEIMDVLRSMYPSVDIPEPLAFYYDKWYSDPLYRGSYSNWPPSFFQEHHDNLRATVSSRLWFAGEHTSQKYYGFLHGAYFEGLEVGTNLANCIKGGGCVGLEHFDEVKNARPYRV